MRLGSIGMIAADTARSRAYAQALVQRDLLPSRTLVLRNESPRPMPGQFAPGGGGGTVELMGLRFDPGAALEDVLAKAGVPVEEIASTAIHGIEMAEAIRAGGEDVFIYSGYGGVILGKAVLGLGVRFLHAHGGYLPDYKGSAANYYSALSEGFCGASTIFLTEDLDGGPVLRRRKFPPPERLEQLDYVYDPLYRAVVLVETLSEFIREGVWKYDGLSRGDGRMYYVMHPVLRHVAILAGREGAAQCE